VGKKERNITWLKEHELPVGHCEIIGSCPLYTSKFLDHNVKKFACEAAQGKVYNTKRMRGEREDTVIAAIECPYLALAKLKISS